MLRSNTQPLTKISAHISKDAWNNDLKQQDVPGLDFFQMNTILTATNNFSPSNKLGQGGFGSVYKVRNFLSSLLFFYFLVMTFATCFRENCKMEKKSL